MSQNWIILGAGYVGSRMARTLRAEGHEVLAVGRKAEKLAALEAIGCRTMTIEASKLRAFQPVFYGQSSPIVFFTIPPIANAPAGEVVRRAAEAATNVGCQRFIYLGSTAVYGSTLSSEWVNEDSPTALSDPDGAPRVADEGTLETIRLAGLNTCVLRLAAIYGPGRGVRERLKKGSYQLIDNGVHYFSRVHVDDIVGVARAAVERAPSGALYCVADRLPSTQREYADWLCDRLGMEHLPDVGDPSYLKAVKNRRVSSDKLVKELDYKFKYPTYKEGELAIEEELAGRGVIPGPAPRQVQVEAAAPVAAAPAEPATRKPKGAAGDPKPAPASPAAEAGSLGPAPSARKLADRLVPIGRNARVSITSGVAFVHKGRVDIGPRELGAGESIVGPATLVALLPSEVFLVEN